ncbi:MAG: YgaP family membrane protein [Anaerolineae bacterium]
MKQNIGEFERILRMVLGVHAMLLGFLFLQNVVGMLLGLLGAISTLTGLVGWCGIYALLDRETVPVTEAEPSAEQEG